MVEGSGDGGSAEPDIDLVTLRPGHGIGRYRIVAVLGQGGFGITYRAVDSELGRDVAIKEFLPTALAVRKDGITVVPRSRTAAEDLAWGLDRFVEEGRTLAALHRAPGIVKVHDYLRANGTAYLVMELVDGETLHDRVGRTGPIDAAAIDRILAPLLDGLEQVHAAGFLHRDIKPANILIDGEGRPTLIDFGASRAAVSGRSQVLTAVFTPGYAPVEQFTSAPQGPWTDIYGLAASLYHAITGAPPINAIDRLLQDSYVPLKGSGRAYPATLLAGIDAALAVRAADRPQSVAAWRAILRGDAGATAPPATVRMPVAASPAAPPPSAPPPAHPAPQRKGIGTKLAAVAGMTLVLAGLGWFALGSGPAPSPAASGPVASAPASGAPVAAAPPPSAVAAVPAPPAADRVQQELEQARREQRAALEEAARLRAEAEARRKADEEAALRARIEQEFREKAAAEEATRRQAAEEAKRQAEAQAAAEAAAKAKAESDAKAAAEEARRQAEAQAAATAAAKAKAEAETKAKADADAAARLQAEEADRKTAEASEAALRLSTTDRQRIQVALTSLGHATGATDGVFGPRSREMIAAWQRKSGRAATGFLTQDQQAALLRDAAPALARYDEEQRKQVAQAPAPGQAAAPSAGGARQCEGTFRSQWCRAAYQGFPPNCWHSSMTIRNGEISDSWISQADRSRRHIVSGHIDANGTVSVAYEGIGQQTHINQRFTAIMSGRITNGVLTAVGRAGGVGREFTVTVACR